jgi:hypothetical protein
VSGNAAVNYTFILTIIAIDKKCTLLFNMKTKHQSVQWKNADSPPLIKFHVDTSAAKMKITVFWDANDTIFKHCVCNW